MKTLAKHMDDQKEKQMFSTNHVLNCPWPTEGPRGLDPGKPAEGHPSPPNRSHWLQRRSQRQAPRQRQQPIRMRMRLHPRQRQRRRFRPVSPSRMTYGFSAWKAGDLRESVLWSMWWQAYPPESACAKKSFYNSKWPCAAVQTFWQGQ